MTFDPREIAREITDDRGCLLIDTRAKADLLGSLTPDQKSDVLFAVLAIGADDELEDE